MIRFILSFTFFLVLAWSPELSACSCVAPPENAVLFSRAQILVDAEVVKVLERTRKTNENHPLIVEAKIVKVYKGEKKLLGKKVTLSGVDTKGTCSYYPPGKIGVKVTLEGPEPYRFSGGCNFVWSPESSQ